MRSSSARNLEHSLDRECRDLQDGTQALSLSLSRQQLEQFLDYFRLIFDFHGRVHLISSQDHTRIAKRHLIPSFMVRPFVHGKALCDMGSGAGLPGIPLAIVEPGLHVVLIESVTKKVEFLEKVKDKLQLDNIDIVHKRAEQHHGDRFDTVLFRAVGTVKKNLRIIDRLLKPGGRAIFFKTHRIEREIKQAQPGMERLGFTAEVHKLYSPLEHRPLAFVILRRIGPRS